MKSNEEWMAAYQQGNQEAFAILYERLYESLYSFLFRYTREEQLSIDTVHDTFEVLQKHPAISTAIKGRSNHMYSKSATGCFLIN